MAAREGGRVGRPAPGRLPKMVAARENRQVRDWDHCELSAVSSNTPRGFVLLRPVIEERTQRQL